MGLAVLGLAIYGRNTVFGEECEFRGTFRPEKLQVQERIDTQSSKHEIELAPLKHELKLSHC